jgi:ADP-heptose:LPS heptosyltransferase
VSGREVRSVLALRALGLGDLLTAVPALRGARRHWPAARLTLAAPAALGGWLRDLGLVDEVLPAHGLAPLPPVPPPDVALNLHGSGPQSHRLLLDARPRHLVAFGCPEAGFGDGPSWRVEHEVDRWVRLLRSVGAECSVEDLRLPAGGPRGAHVVVHPGAASPSRRWPAERWAAVARALGADGRRVVVTGTADEAAACATVAAAAGGDSGAVDRCGRDDLASLADLVASAALVLSGDTGVAHLATAFGTPSVVLFGPVDPDLWGPRVDPDLHAVLWHGSPDRPGDPHATVLDPALARIAVEEVLDAAGGLLARPVPVGADRTA